MILTAVVMIVVVMIVVVIMVVIVTIQRQCAACSGAKQLSIGGGCGDDIGRAFAADMPV